MKTPTDHQIVMHDGIPIAVVIPYVEYLALIDGFGATKEEEPPLADADIEAVRQDKHTLPHEVMGFIINKKMTPIRAWREYLGMTQADVAARMGVTQATYAKMESGKTSPRVATLKNIALALDIHYFQLDLK
jgi:DNA-binding XRE family transcriptional regulator